MEPITNTLLHIKSTFPKFSPSEQKVAKRVLEQPEQVVHLSITELAWEAGVSDATVVKFCKRLGYKGYQEFKIFLAQDVVVKPGPIYGEVQLGDEVLTVKEKIFQANRTALHDTARVLSAEVLESAVQAIAQAGKLHFYGFGASGIVALDAEQKFSRIGFNVSAFLDGHTQITRAVLLQAGDVAVGLSYSGETDEIVESLEFARAAGALTIAITNYPTSSVALAADLVLLTASEEDVFRSGAISSRIAQLSVIDTLFISVAILDFEHSLQSVKRTKEALSQRKIKQMKV